MNEITAAIKAKAEEIYSNQTDPMLFALVEISKEAYTCGGEDAIGVHEKFDHWKADNYWQYFKQEKKYYNMVDNTVNPLTYTELFAKYLMEDNKL